MKRIGRWLAYGLALVLGLLGVGFGYVLLAYPPEVPVPDVHVDGTEEQVERGRYLVQHVAMCLDCHSRRDWSLYSGPVVAGSEGGGGPVEFFGPVANSANITPFALGDWSDGEVVRAITSGIKKDGRAVHPLMPFDSYAAFLPEDILAIVAYSRTLEPIERPVEETGGLLRLIGRLLPRPWEPRPPLDLSDPIVRGEYLVEVAECTVCHSSDLGGGRVYELPSGGARRASNISPDATGIGALGRDNFIGIFRAFASEASRRIPVPEDQVGTVMPWTRYAGMTEEDLGAIYAYLRSRPPVVRQVTSIAWLPGQTPEAR